MIKFAFGIFCGILLYYGATNRSEDFPDKTILEHKSEQAGDVFKDITEQTGDVFEGIKEDWTQD